MTLPGPLYTSANFRTHDSTPETLRKVTKVGYREMEWSPTAQKLTFQESRWIQIGSIAWLKRVA